MKRAVKRKRKKSFTLFQKLSHQLIWGSVRLLWAATRFFPWPLFQGAAKIIAAIASFTMTERREIALNNLTLAFGTQMGRGERERLFRKSIQNFCVGAFEVLHFARFPEKLNETRIVLEGEEHLEEALSLGRGVLALSGHLGNFVAGLIKLSQAGYPINVVVRQPRIEPLARFVSELRHRVGVGEVADQPPEECVRRCLELLRRKEILFLQIDLNVSGGGAYVDFFGQLVPTFKGPAVLALRTGAPIVPVFVVRGADGRHRVIIEPAVQYEASDDSNQDVLTLTAKLSKIVEKYVRTYPEEWLWIHRRFRHARPILSP